MKSISNALLTRVLSIYLVLTTLLFGLDVAIEYVETKADIVSELDTLHATFGGNVGYTMWHMFDDQLDVTLTGVLNIPSVSRVLVLAPGGEVVRNFESSSPAKHVDFLPHQLFSSVKPITHGAQQLGWLEIQSNSDVIFNKMKTRLLVNFIAALIETVVLILLVKLFFDQVLSRPLFRIANQAAKLDPHSVELQPLPVKTDRPDELDVIAGAINRLATDAADAIGDLNALNKNLEEQVAQRTAQLQMSVDQLGRQREELTEEVKLRVAREASLWNVNQLLESSLERLQIAQDTLVQQEKLAALGGLVAGVAHEINTPIGLGLTGASQFQYLAEQLIRKYEAKDLAESEFKLFLADTRELARSIMISLEKAAALVQSFKMVAVDQGHDSLRQFNVAKYIEDVLLTHHAKLRKAGVTARLECDPKLDILSNPGSWSQILSNLIANSVTHGFAERSSDNEIVISVCRTGEQLCLDYRDNGKGMDEDTAKHIFDPFFTTNRHNGGSGLGMHVVFNLVTQQLGGKIDLDTEPGRGTAFRITMPAAAQDQTI